MTDPKPLSAAEEAPWPITPGRNAGSFVVMTKERHAQLLTAEQQLDAARAERDALRKALASTECRCLFDFDIDTGHYRRDKVICKCTRCSVLASLTKGD